MSGYEIPFHIQEEIMKRLPVKSLIRFRSVLKAWKSLIDSPQFIAAHSLLSHTQPHHLLVSYSNQHLRGEEKYVSFDDDDTFPQHWSVLTLPLSLKQLVNASIVGISHGLVCFCFPINKRAVIWNPSIRKSISVAVPNFSSIGFGVCPVTCDPKIVSVTQSYMTEADIEIKVMVYTLSSGKWTSLSTDLPTQPLPDWNQAVAADGFIYWLGGYPGQLLIISFDLTNETFQMIDLPTTLARLDFRALQIDKLRESLAIIQYKYVRSTSTYIVWKMEGGVQRSFTKLFRLHVPPNCKLAGFRKSGMPIVEVVDDGKCKLVVYQPNSEHKNVFAISRVPALSTVKSYMETLLLLGRSDCSSY